MFVLCYKECKWLVWIFIFLFIISAIDLFFKLKICFYLAPCFSHRKFDPKIWILLSFCTAVVIYAWSIIWSYTDVRDANIQQGSVGWVGSWGHCTFSHVIYLPYKHYFVLFFWFFWNQITMCMCCVFDFQFRFHW